MIDEGAPLDVRQLEAGSRQLGPWTSDAFVRVMVMNLIGILLVAISWFQMSGQLTVADQLSWLEVGFVGVGVCGAANGLWLLRGRRSIGFARRLLWPTRPAGPIDADGVRSSSDLRFAPGTRRFHLPTCALLVDRPARSISRADATRQHLAPCEVCEP